MFSCVCLCAPFCSLFCHLLATTCGSRSCQRALTKNRIGMLTVQFLVHKVSSLHMHQCYPIGRTLSCSISSWEVILLVTCRWAAHRSTNERYWRHMLGIFKSATWRNLLPPITTLSMVTLVICAYNTAYEAGSMLPKGGSSTGAWKCVHSLLDTDQFIVAQGYS
jgi:hypothetical protein